MKANYSLKNNNCQTFCKTALNYLKKITSNNEFYSPTYTFGNNEILHMVDIPLIQSHKAIRSSIDNINSAILFASDVFAFTKRSKKSSKLKPIAEGISKSTIRRQHQHRRQRLQNQRKLDRERKSKLKKSTSKRPRKPRRSKTSQRKQHPLRKHRKTHRL